MAWPEIDTALKPPESNLPKNQRYKTQLCKNFELDNSCKWGKNCSFAHGLSEMKINSKDLTFNNQIVCKDYYELLDCHQNPFCPFLHIRRDDFYSNIIYKFSVGRSGEIRIKDKTLFTEELVGLNLFSKSIPKLRVFQLIKD